ncbi:MAG TPA: PIG-L family deacetylase [Burkholderiales bacterium]|nr:PIG-L family deacetylase [Burkholderiales bacterium]
MKKSDSIAWGRPWTLMPVLLAGLAVCNSTGATEREAAAALARLPGRASFFIAAHPDDIELFMARNAWSDIKRKHVKTVFVVLTAGDAGQGKTSDGVREPYYRAREIGHQRAVRYWASLSDAESVVPREEVVTISGQVLQRQSIGEDIALYNVRLPDGNGQGTGYPATGQQSLTLLRSGGIPAIRSIDSKLLLSYDELKALMQGIVAHEARGSRKIWIHIIDEDGGSNPSDHADHTATSEMVRDALSEYPYTCASFARYTSYANARKPQNYSLKDSVTHVATMDVLNSGLIDGGHAKTSHDPWLKKQYFRSRDRRSLCNF